MLFHVGYWGVMLTFVPKCTHVGQCPVQLLSSSIICPHSTLLEVVLDMAVAWTARHFTKHDAALCCRLGAGWGGRMFTFTSTCTRLGYLQKWHCSLVSEGIRTALPTDCAMCHPAWCQRPLQHACCHQNKYVLVLTSCLPSGWCAMLKPAIPQQLSS